MKQQRSLFETETAPWVLRLWSTIEEERRQEVLAILAEMARDRLLALPQASKEGKTHES